MNKPVLRYWTFLIVILLAVNANGTTASFDDAAALQVDSAYPILNNDVHQAYQQAINSAFRQALNIVLEEMTLNGWEGSRNVIMKNPERYIQGYRIVEQSRKDLFYRLKMLIWVNAQLLKKEAQPDGHSIR